MLQIILQNNKIPDSDQKIVLEKFIKKLGVNPTSVTSVSVIILQGVCVAAVHVA